MKTQTNTTNGDKLLEFVYNKYQNNELTNANLVQLLILLFDLLQLHTIATFCKKNNKTYKGVRDFNKNIIDINGNKFVIDNE